MTAFPDYRAQGLVTRDHDLGATMSQRPCHERRLPRLDPSESAAERRTATARRAPRRLRESTEPVA